MVLKWFSAAVLLYRLLIDCTVHDPRYEFPLFFQNLTQCRTYDYIGEAACDARTSTFLECIRAVRDQTPGGFAAVKLSALGDPALLGRLTTCLRVSGEIDYSFSHMTS